MKGKIRAAARKLGLNPKSHKLGKGARRIFGFEKRWEIDKIKKPDSIDEDELIVILATMKADMNWLKRGFWLILATLLGTSVAL